MTKRKKIDTRPQDKKPDGAIYKDEMYDQHQRDIKRLEQAKKKCNKKIVKLCDQFNTYIGGGTEETRERLKWRLEPKYYIVDKS